MVSELILKFIVTVYTMVRNISLLSLDGGGVRGLSSLYILKHIMESIDPDNTPKPCEYFDLIGGSGSGG